MNVGRKFRIELPERRCSRRVGVIVDNNNSRVIIPIIAIIIMASEEEGNARRPGEEGCGGESQSPRPSIELDVGVIHNLSKVLAHAI